MASHQSIGAQIGEDVDQELRGNTLGLSQILGPDHNTRCGRGELDHGADAIFRFSRHPHAADSATDRGFGENADRQPRSLDCAPLARPVIFPTVSATPLTAAPT